MKRLVACLLLPLILGGCDPFPKDDDAPPPSVRDAVWKRVAEATAAPPPAKLALGGTTKVLLGALVLIAVFFMAAKP